MSDTAFTNGITVTDADWFNDLNRLHYTIFGDPANVAAARSAISAAASGAIGSSGLTMATARLLGRTTAGTGAAEEVSVGAGLALSALTLATKGGWEIVAAEQTASAVAA